MIIIGSIAHDIITKKDVVLQVAYINGFPNVENVEFMADFSRTLGIDEKKEETLLDTSLYISSDSSSSV